MFHYDFLNETFEDWRNFSDMTTYICPLWETT